MNAVLQVAYRQLGAGEAIRIHGGVTARHPAGASLSDLAALRDAIARHGHLVRNREQLDFRTWADRIEADPLAAIDHDRNAIVAALRALHRAAQPPVATTLLQRLHGALPRLLTAPATPRTTP